MTTDREQIIAAAKEAGVSIVGGEDGTDAQCWTGEFSFSEYGLEAFYAIAFEAGAARYNELRRGQHWSVLDGIGNVIRGDDLDVAVDKAIRARENNK